MSRKILLVTYDGDGVADIMARTLERRGADPVRLDTDRFPTDLRLSMAQGPDGAGVFSLDGLALSEIDAVWYRRFYNAKLPDGLQEKYRKHCAQESNAVLHGLFAALRGALWVDPIDRVRMAHHKPLQLEVARRVGLLIPDTLTTNDPVAARAFFEKHEGQVVTKMLSSFHIVEGQMELMVFTSTVTEEDLEALDGLRVCPMVFQQKLPKDVELRVTVVGDRLFVASIDVSSSVVAQDDWRKDGLGLAGKFTVDTLPEAEAQAVLRLMRAFGLHYGALDFIRRPDGSHVFLEINSAGEWGWIKESVGLAVDEALADLLTGAVRCDRSQPQL